jgi:hypothetical protein
MDRRRLSNEEKYQKILAKADLFWSRVDKSDPDGCWPWLGAFDKDGYGFLNIKPTLVKAHRAAWILSHGMITSEEQVLHRCDNRSCCNPTHHFLGNNDLNVADMVSKGRQSKGEKNSAAVKSAHDAMKKRDPDLHRRLYGGPHLGRKNCNAKLCDDDVKLIRAMAGTHREVADSFKISRSVVAKIRRRELWRHIA